MTSPRSQPDEGTSSADGEIDRALREVDRAQETDVWWGGYAGRAMTGSVLVCGLVTAVVVAGAWYLWHQHEVDRLSARYWVYGLLGALWALQVGRWIYRLVVYNYRLTTRRLLIELAFHNYAREEVELGRVGHVLVEQGPWQRWIGVGTLRVERTGEPPLMLRDLRAPRRVARLIRAQVQRARQRDGVSVPPPKKPDPVAGHREGDM